MTRLMLLVVLGTALAGGAPITNPGLGNELEQQSLLPPHPELMIQLENAEGGDQAGNTTGPIFFSTASSLVVVPSDSNSGEGGVDGGGEIPEPSTLSLVALAGALLAWKRRRK